MHSRFDHARAIIIDRKRCRDEPPGKEELFLIGKTLKKHWLRPGVRLNRGASEGETAAFGVRYRVRLTEDMP
jgi:hypothetical protein